MKWWQKLLANTIIFLVLAGFFQSGFHIDSWVTALIAAAVFGVLNVIVKPILVFFSLPITILTMGFFYFVINGFILWLTDALVAGFEFSSFWVAFFVAIIVSLLNSYLTSGYE